MVENPIVEGNRSVVFAGHVVLRPDTRMEVSSLPENALNIVEIAQTVPHPATSESNGFLLKEYELCFAQLRYYDDRNTELLKYTYTLTSSVAAAQFAVFQLVKGPTSAFYLCQGFLGGLVFLATLLLYLAMIQNRLYFVAFARQLNAIRQYMLETASPGFRHNQLPTSTGICATNPFSAHTYLFIGVAVISSLFAAMTAYGLASAYRTHHVAVVAAIVVFCFVLIGEVVGGRVYLAANDHRSTSEGTPVAVIDEGCPSS